MLLFFSLCKKSFQNSTLITDWDISAYRGVCKDRSEGGQFQRIEILWPEVVRGTIFSLDRANFVAISEIPDKDELLLLILQ